MFGCGFVGFTTIRDEAPLSKARGYLTLVISDKQIEPGLNRPGHRTDHAHRQAFFHWLEGEWIRQNEYATVIALEDEFARTRLQ